MSERAAAHIDRGWELHAQRQYEQAIEEFRKAIEVDGNAIDAYYGLGLAAKAAGRKETAIAAFEKVLTLLPTVEDRGKAQILSRLTQAHLQWLRGSNGEA
ncbi:tetratricopeptide repeat protein [Thermoflexus hugenholtzii]|uniref:TPR repeat-containing protein n=1 Tax=Thermoflexus hugenholtzii JAD2 TaxID=877466 RepID=A0A212RE53_9CHLR|nr:tetratricopeptide repeat protein [Thermoflexus hugenholtzii]SNB70523.1 TPR repeat-containing protein [Thermoflexus hugenholtzii JAD2]